MAKRKKNLGFPGNISSKYYTVDGQRWAMITVTIPADMEKPFLRAVARIDEIRTVGLWNQARFLDSPSDGRRPKKETPLWDAYLKAKAKNSGLSRKQFVMDFRELEHDDESAIHSALVQLKREERRSQKVP
jgi:uncharacterized protein YbcC (UPF0753/DUF2309 family)